jgi:hypothetical protein
MRHSGRYYLLALLLGASLASASPMLYTLGTVDGMSYTVSSIDSSGNLTPLLGVGYGFTGGLAFDPTANVFYAISNDSDALSTLNAISWSGEVTPLFQLGYGFFGGLAWGGDAGILYAIGGDADGIQRDLYVIDVAGGTAELVEELADGRFSFDGGLAFTDLVYTMGSNFESSRLFSYAPLAEVQMLDGFYRSLVFPAAGGLALDPESGTWWALSFDPESGVPLLVNFGSSGELSRTGLNAAVTGLTFADSGDNVPEPGPGPLAAAGLAAILGGRWWRRDSKATQGRRS